MPVKIVVSIYAQTFARATGNALIMAVAALVISLVRTVQLLRVQLLVSATGMENATQRGSVIVIRASLVKIVISADVRMIVVGMVFAAMVCCVNVMLDGQVKTVVHKRVPVVAFMVYALAMIFVSAKKDIEEKIVR